MYVILFLSHLSSRALETKESFLQGYKKYCCYRHSHSKLKLCVWVHVRGSNSVIYIFASLLNRDLF